jgi:NADPH:quinone reductase-like Zn-dependent oxidoreductase
MPKAVVLTQYGPPDVLAWRDVPMPEPGPGQVRIRVKAAGVGPTDLKIRRGKVRFARPPDAVLGFEAAGVVDTLGPSVSGIEEGDEVASSCPLWAATASMLSHPPGLRSRRRLPGAMLLPCPLQQKPQWAP